MGVIYGFITGERITEESAAHGHAEERGWVDPSWSWREFFDSRNDVSPVFKAWEQHAGLPDALRRDDFADAVREAIAGLGAVEDNGDGTFYAVDADEDYATGDHYLYALHFTVKRAAGEAPWHPADAGVDVSDLCVGGLR